MLICAIKQYFIDFSDTVSTVRSIMLWLAIAITLAMVIAIFIKKDNKVLKKVFFVIGAVYVSAALVIFSIFTAKENEADGGVSPYSFYPMLVFACIVIATAFVLAISKNAELKKTFIGITILSLELIVILLIVYYITGEPNERNYLSEGDVNTWALWVASVVLIGALVGLTFLDKNKVNFDAKSITYAGIMVALSFALSYVRVIKMPMGGSITFASLLPIMLYSYMFGIKKGVVIGVIYGVLQAIQDPWILHPAQFLLDYPIAFAGIGLAGILRNKKMKPALSFAIGAIIAAMFRLFAHFLSGVFAFGSYASYYDMTSPYLYSIAYNATFVLPDAAIAIVVGVILTLNKSFSKALLNVGTK